MSNMDEPKTFRIFVFNEDSLHLESMCAKHGVTITFGGEPLRVPTLNGFERDGSGAQWSVAYLSGGIVSITNLQNEWRTYLSDTSASANEYQTPPPPFARSSP